MDSITHRINWETNCSIETEEHLKAWSNEQERNEIQEEKQRYRGKERDYYAYRSKAKYQVKGDPYARVFIFLMKIIINGMKFINSV